MSKNCYDRSTKTPLLKDLRSETVSTFRGDDGTIETSFVSNVKRDRNRHISNPNLGSVRLFTWMKRIRLP